MQTSDVLSTLALAISVASFATSFYVAYQDRPRLKIRSKFIEPSEYGPGKIHVTMINIGRRPVMLRLIGGSDAKGAWSATFMEKDKGGLRLAEHERHEEFLSKEDTVQFVPDGVDIFFETMWIEDSLGTRHPIPNSAPYIKKLWL